MVLFPYITYFPEYVYYSPDCVICEIWIASHMIYYAFGSITSMKGGCFNCSLNAFSISISCAE